MRGRSLAWTTLALLLAPSATAQGIAHENFARTEADPEALQALGGTLLNFTERAFVATLAGDEANASRSTRLTLALTEDLALISQISEIESAALIAPYVGPYSRLAKNASSVATRIAMLDEATPDEHAQIALLARDDVVGMYADADAFETLGHDATRLRELLGLLLDLLDVLQPGPRPDIPVLILSIEPERVPLGRDLVARVLVVMERPPQGAQLRFALDGAPWAVARTDANGGARVAQRMPLDARLGTHELAVSADVAGTTLETKRAFEVTRVPTRLVLTAAERVVPPERDVILRARLTEDTRAPIGSAPVQLQIDDGAPTTVTFLSDGSLALRLRAGELPEGRHEATLAYSGDERREPAFARARWEIGQPRPPGEPGGAPSTGEAPEDLGPFPEPVDLPARVVRVTLQQPPVVLWPVLVVGVLLFELATARWVAMRTRSSPPPGAHAPPPEALPATHVAAPAPPARDARAVVLAGYRDLMLVLAREGVPIASMTHREIARELVRLGYDRDAIADITTVFENVRYASRPADRRAVQRFLPSLVRLLRQRRSA